MISLFLKYGGYFILLVLFQVLMLNNVQLGGYVNPYLYIIFIIALPFETPNWLLLLLGFLLGMTIDIFTNTLGMHASATVFMSFVRYYVLKYLEPREGYDYNDKPTAQVMGLKWFSIYASILVLSHHVFLFYIEAFKFSQFFITLSRVILSFIVTMVLVFIVQLFNYKSSSKT